MSKISLKNILKKTFKKNIKKKTKKISTKKKEGNKKVRTKAISILCQTNAIELKEITSPSIAVNPAIKTKKCRCR